MLVHAALIALIVSCGTPYAANMSNSLFLLTESNALLVKPYKDITSKILVFQTQEYLVFLDWTVD